MNRFERVRVYANTEALLEDQRQIMYESIGTTQRKHVCHTHEHPTTRTTQTLTGLLLRDGLELGVAGFSPLSSSVLDGVSRLLKAFPTVVADSDGVGSGDGMDDVGAGVLPCLLRFVLVGVEVSGEARPPACFVPRRFRMDGNISRQIRSLGRSGLVLVLAKPSVSAAVLRLVECLRLVGGPESGLVLVDPFILFLFPKEY